MTKFIALLCGVLSQAAIAAEPGMVFEKTYGKLSMASSECPGGLDVRVLRSEGAVLSIEMDSVSHGGGLPLSLRATQGQGMARNGAGEAFDAFTSVNLSHKSVEITVHHVYSVDEEVITYYAMADDTSMIFEIRGSEALPRISCAYSVLN